MNIAQAEAKLSEQVARAEAGEEVIIARGGKPVVWLNPTVPRHHGDPFDRLLAARALVEGIPILSADARMAAYGGDVIW